MELSFEACVLFCFLFCIFLTGQLRCEKLFQPKTKGERVISDCTIDIHAFGQVKLKSVIRLLTSFILLELCFFYTALFVVGYFSVYNNTGRSGLVTPSIGDALAVKSGD